MPSVSPFSSTNDTSCTAHTTPWRVWKLVRRCSTLRSGMMSAGGMTKVQGPRRKAKTIRPRVKALLPHRLDHWALVIGHFETHSILCGFWIESVAQAVAEEVQRKQCDRENRAREKKQPRKLLDILCAFIDEHP